MCVLWQRTTLFHWLDLSVYALYLWTWYGLLVICVGRMRGSDMMQTWLEIYNHKQLINLDVAHVDSMLIATLRRQDVVTGSVSAVTAVGRLPFFGRWSVALVVFCVMSTGC